MQIIIDKNKTIDVSTGIEQHLTRFEFQDCETASGNLFFVYWYVASLLLLHRYPVPFEVNDLTGFSYVIGEDEPDCVCTGKTTERYIGSISLEDAYRGYDDLEVPQYTVIYRESLRKTKLKLKQLVKLESERVDDIEDSVLYKGVETSCPICQSTILRRHVPIGKPIEELIETDYSHVVYDKCFLVSTKTVADVQAWLKKLLDAELVERVPSMFVPEAILKVYMGKAHRDHIAKLLKKSKKKNHWLAKYK